MLLAMVFFFLVGERPLSEVRKPSRRLLARTSERKGRSQIHDSSAAFRFAVPVRTCCRQGRNFKSAALGALDHSSGHMPTVWYTSVPAIAAGPTAL
jgi:hypothetical protein